MYICVQHSIILYIVENGPLVWNAVNAINSCSQARQKYNERGASKNMWPATHAPSCYPQLACRGASANSVVYDSKILQVKRNLPRLGKFMCVRVCVFGVGYAYSTTIKFALSVEKRRVYYMCVQTWKKGYFCRKV